MHTAKWPDLQAVAKNWITDHRHNRISVSKKITIFKARRRVATYGIPFSGTSCCYRFCSQTVRREKSVKSLKKHTSNVSVLQMI
jgi:hypothetical protein